MVLKGSEPLHYNVFLIGMEIENIFELWQTVSLVPLLA